MAELGFVDRCEAVHLLGPPGTGKSHLATALGVEAAKAGRSVYFATLADIIGVLTKAEREGRLREKIRFFCRAALLIVDEIGYLPVTPGGGNLFFQLVNARYEKGAMILTSNRGFAEWGEVFGDAVVATALLDRLLTTASSSRSKAPATGSATMPSSPSTSDPRRSSPRPSHQPRNDGGADLGEPGPCRLIAAEPERALQFGGRDTLLRRRDFEEGPEPQHQRLLALFEDRPGDDRNLPATAGALVDHPLRRQEVGSVTGAVGAAEALRPFQPSPGTHDTGCRQRTGLGTQPRCSETRTGPSEASTIKCILLLFLS